MPSLCVCDFSVSCERLCLCAAGGDIDLVGGWPLHAVQQLLCHLWRPLWLHQLWQDCGHRQHLQRPCGAVAAALHLLGAAWPWRRLHPPQLSTGIPPCVLPPHPPLYHPFFKCLQVSSPSQPLCPPPLSPPSFLMLARVEGGLTQACAAVFFLFWKQELCTLFISMCICMYSVLGEFSLSDALVVDIF